MNSHPITELSSDSYDPIPLTPGRFLIGSPLNALHEVDVTNTSESRLMPYERLTKIFQHFWACWSKDYLSNLQKRAKWCSSTPDCAIGYLVLLKEDGASPLLWQMGRIVSLHPGSDNRVRVVSVKTSSGILKRSLQMICPLPVNE